MLANQYSQSGKPVQPMWFRTQDHTTLLGFELWWDSILTDSVTLEKINIPACASVLQLKNWDSINT